VRVLIVRPAPGNAATAHAVRALGLEPAVVPLFEIVPLGWTVPDPHRFDAVIMTSANAARLGGDGLVRFVHLPLFAVGEATGKAAEAAGFVQVQCGTGDVAALAPLLPARILHLTGADHRPIPGPAEVTVIPVYESREREPVKPLRADVALIHSPRAGSRLAALVGERRATRIVAISAAAAAACGTGWAAIDVADVPNEHAMLACLARVCEAPLKNQMGRA
jgi:uroporphyrinogen-III synthase